jgi:hypothetical protein
MGWMSEQRRPLPAQGAVATDERRTLILGLEQRLAPRCTLSLEVTDIDGRGGAAATGAATRDYALRTLRCMLDVEF